MNKKEFGLALGALLPHCDPDAPQKWADFAAECVENEQYAYFMPMEHDAAVEKWLDTTFAGLCAVKQEYGLEIAAKVADLACQRCALYPGEMLVAAMILEGGGDAERIESMLAYGDIELEPDAPFFLDLPDGAALTQQGREIAISRSGVLCGLVQKRMEPGYVLADGTALLESERDSFGRWRGGTGMDGMYLQTGQLYAPVRDADGAVKAFQEVKPVMAREREAAYLADQADAFAIYRMAQADTEGYTPLDRLRKSGASPLDGSYNLIHVVQLERGTDSQSMLDACRAVDTLRPGDIAVFKQDGILTCWYVEQLAFTRLRGMLENCLKAAELGTEQNANQVDGIINNEAPKPSLRDNLKQCQQEAEASKPANALDRPSQGQDR